MPKYKVLVKNPIEIGKFKSENGILNVVNATDKEKKRVENAIKSGLIKEQVSPTKTADK